MPDLNKMSVVRHVIVENEVQFSLIELSHACQSEVDELVALVNEGILRPTGDGAVYWRFDGSAFSRARVALRLLHDLQINHAGTALVLDLLDEITKLRSYLGRPHGH